MIGQSQELLTSLGKSMARSAPQGWEQVEVRITAAGPMTGTTFMATKADGSVDRKIALDHDGQDAAAQLRKEMFQPSKGAWYNAGITLTRSGQLNADFDYDTPPFEGDADPDLLIEDHQLFPRDPENLPAWHPAK
jgi:hypothetical protein